MTSASAKIVQLRHLLGVRGQFCLPNKADEPYLTGLAALDEIGVPRGALSEMVASRGLGAGVDCSSMPYSRPYWAGASGWY